MLSAISQDTDSSSGPDALPEPTRRVVRMLSSAMALFDRHVTPREPHGNQRLHVRGMIGTLLAAAFEPAARSLRTIDDLSLHRSLQSISGVQRVARSTLSDALARFDPQQLRPLVQAIQRQLPQLQRLDPDTAAVAGRIVAADGSWFNLAGEVVHALHCRRGHGEARQSRVRLNLQLDVDTFLPQTFDVSGDGDGDEAGAFARSLRSGCVYLLDRNFVHFRFLNAVLAAESSFVLRLKKGVGFTASGANELTDKDMAHGVLADDLGTLPGPGSRGNADARSCTDRPPTRTLRRVTVWDEPNKCQLLLLTDLLDVPAYVVGVLYRLRWQIELFFRWLKVLAGFGHLYSQSERGITTQFYVAVLMTLLIHLHTGGKRPSKYALIWVSWIAQGRADPEQMAAALARHERERQQARARRATKKKSI